MRTKTIKTIRELRNFLKDEIQFFKRESQKAQNQAYKDVAQGRLKEAQWILSNLRVE
jgi:hypothetical protein